MQLSSDSVLPGEKHISPIIVFFVYKKDQEITRFAQRKSTHAGICMYGPVDKSIISISRKITFSFWRECKLYQEKIISIDPAHFLVFKILTDYYQNKLIKCHLKNNHEIYYARAWFLRVFRFVFGHRLFWSNIAFSLENRVKGNHCWYEMLIKSFGSSQIL